MWLFSLRDMDVNAGKANTNVSKHPIGKGKNAVSSDMVHEDNDYASRTKSHQGLREAVCSCVYRATIHSAQNEPEKQAEGRRQQENGNV